MVGRDVEVDSAHFPRASPDTAWIELSAAPADEQIGAAFDTEGAVGRHLQGCVSRALAAISDGVRLELVHWADRDDLAQGRLRFALGGHVNPDADPALGRPGVEHARRSLPAAFEWSDRAAAPYDAQRLSADGWTLHEVRRQELVTEPQAPDAESAYYYYPVPLRGDGSGWAGLAHVLLGCDDPFVVSLVFMRASYYEVEHRVAQYLAGQLSTLGQTRTVRNAWGEQIPLTPDVNAAAAAEAWRFFAHDNPHPVLGRCYVAASSLSTAARVARSVAEFSSSELPNHASRTAAPATSQRVPSGDLALAWAALDAHAVAPTGGHEGWASGALPGELRRFPYFFTAAEAALMTCFPTPDRQGCPGFPRARRIAQRRAARALSQAPDGITLGHFLDAGRVASPASISLRALNRHLLVVGSPGSGKTTTVLALLLALWRERAIPFLALEPVKTEYRELLREDGMDALWVFTAGQERHSPLRLNPLDVPADVAVEEQIGKVMAIFQAALPLEPPLPQLLEDAVEEAYFGAGWSLDDTGADAVELNVRPPTLRDVRSALDAVFDRRGYAADVRHNLHAALGVRLESLLRGARGRMFDTLESLDWEELLKRPVIIELDALADQRDKALVGTMIMDKVRSVARSRGAQHALRHITVLEEAHSMLASVSEQSAQSLAIKSLCDDIAELRSLGEGFVLADQRPADLAQAAIANCGSRIVHRLAAAEHRDLVLRDFDTTALETQAAARLDEGEALVRFVGMEEPELMRVAPPEHRAQGADERLPLDAVEVGERMADVARKVRALLPRAECTRAICTEGCNPDRRRGAERFAQRWRRASAAPAELARAAIDAVGTRQADVYCAVLHGSDQVRAVGGTIDFAESVTAARTLLAADAADRT